MPEHSSILPGAAEAFLASITTTHRALPAPGSGAKLVVTLCTTEYADKYGMQEFDRAAMVSTCKAMGGHFGICRLELAPEQLVN